MPAHLRCSPAKADLELSASGLFGAGVLGVLGAVMRRGLGLLPPEQRDRFFWKNAKTFYSL